MLEAKLINRNELDIQRWDKFIDQSPQQAMYAYSWYLDKVNPDWRAIIIKKKENWEAVFPLPFGSKYGQEYALTPYFVQYLGIFLRPDIKSKSRVYHNFKQLLSKVIETIPASTKVLDLNLHPSVDYLLPFHWAGYSISPRYTYWLPLNEELEKVRSGFTDSIKSDLKRTVREGITCEQG